MLAHRYTIWPDAWGPRIDPDGPNEKRLVGITALAKRDPEAPAPYEVFNELVAMRLGQLIGLPVPAGLVIERDRQLYFCSCHIGAAGGSELPKADLERFAREKPVEACGVTVFDAWIANTDRHDDNLWYDYYAKLFVVFDHGQSVLGTSGAVHLRSYRNCLGIRIDPPCLSRYIENFHAFRHWYDRILDVPKHVVRQTTEQAASVGVDEELARECAEWLLARRERLPDLFRSSLTDFPKYRADLLDPFADPYVFLPEYYI